MYNPRTRKELVYIHATKLGKGEVPDDRGTSPNPSRGCSECTDKRPVSESQEADYNDSPSENHSIYCNSFLSIGQKEQLLAIKDQLFYFFVPVWSWYKSELYFQRYRLRSQLFLQLEQRKRIILWSLSHF